MYAASGNSVRCLRLLLCLGAEVDARGGSEDATALHVAAYTGATQVGFGGYRSE